MYEDIAKHNILTRLEDFVTEFGDDVRYEVGVSVGKEWHGGYKRTAVVVDDVLS